MIRNMNQNMNDLKKELCSVSFAMFDIMLFLDTHPDSKEALQEYCLLSERARTVKKAYEEASGMPITADDACIHDEWKWVNEPWPWQMSKG
ncbi:MAG: spore coat protein CotJB [Oscillospiraceae bacterium]|nr:spore coat protein CotJB [Oscillospiraceae bacterium]